MKKILNRIPSPPGAIPAKARTWLLVCLTAAIALTLVSFPGQEPARQGGATDDPTSTPEAPASSVAVSSVEHAARRLREDASRRAERRLRAELGVSEPRPDGLPNPPQPVGSAPPLAGSSGSGHGPSVQEQIEQEERLRRYHSLRAPALVQTARTSLAANSASGAEDLPEEASIDPDDSTAGGYQAQAAGPPATAIPSTRDESQPRSTPRTWVLREGDFLEAVLMNRLSGEFAGPVGAMVSADVYDRQRQYVLVPRGTRALGEASRVGEWGQSRLAVTFHRLILPDGTAVDLGEDIGLNQIGETGLRDRVNRHYLSTFAAAGAVGVLAGLSQAASPQEILTSRLGAARASASSGLSRSAERVLDRYLNRLPKVTVREGHRIRIHLTRDLELPAFPAQHTEYQGDSK